MNQRIDNIAIQHRRRSPWRRWVRMFAAAVCCLQLASITRAAEPELVKLAVSEGKDIFFSHLTWKDGLSPGSIGQILQDELGFLWIRSGVLDRYDGNEFKSYRRDAAHPNNPAGSALHHVLIDRTGALWVTSNESFDRFDPATETSTRFAIDRDGLNSVRQPQHVLQDSAGILWLATATGLHRLDPATGEFRHYAHDPADPDSLASSEVTSTYEDPHGTLWVLTLAGLDAFDRRTERVTERIHFSLPDGRGLNNALEDHSGVLWITYASGNGLASWDRRTRRITRYSFKDREPPASQLSGVAGIHEDADGYLWLATYGSGLVRIDPNRRSAVQYRHSPLQANGISDNQLGAVF
ncbi:MAG TPA: two-component regulator propeller domain-containing protein, partial [Vicinamibacterales bacterium]